MVLYFTSTATTPPCLIYMGRDKYENEDLIKYGWEEDFHVDKLSSAHVYVRLSQDLQWDDLPAELLIDCAQLVKANSIEGNKLNNIRIVYTPWSNLKKTGDMAVGQVSFHNHKLVRRVNRQEEEKLKEEGRKAKEQQSYSDLFDYAEMSTNTARQYTSVEEAEDDFM
ncbi:protein Y54G11A.2 [Syncephalis fuscata]|nr:protein Y54G11A.2 [Syncephalis fuscata]